MTGPATVARGREALIDVALTPAARVAGQALAEERLQRFVGHDDDWQALVALQRRAHGQPPDAAPSVLTGAGSTGVVIHSLHLHSALPQEGLLDAFEEGGHTAGVHVLAGGALHSCQNKRPVVPFISAVEPHGRPEARQLRAGHAQEMKVVVGQEVLHGRHTKAQQDAVIHRRVGKRSEENASAAGDRAVDAVVAKHGQIERAVRGPGLGAQLAGAPRDAEEAGHSRGQGAVEGVQHIGILWLHGA